MLYPIELRLHEEQINKSSFARSVKPDFCERKWVSRVVRNMKAVKPDSLLPFAIAAILGFLVLGLSGGEKPESSRVGEPRVVVTSPSDHDGQPVKKLADLPAKLDTLSPP